MFERMAAVALGGMLGASARYGLSQTIPRSGGGFPWATLIENVAGSLLLGVAMVVIARRFSSTSLVRPFAAVGFLGSFTTFSAVMVEGDLLVRDGDPGLAVLYWAVTLAAGLVAALVGIVVSMGAVAPRTEAS